MTLIALDIETDTSPLTPAEEAEGYTARGLNPAITPITAIVIAEEGQRDNPHVLMGDEASMLAELEDFLENHVESGARIVTWNGAVFDMPFIYDRAHMLGVDVPLRLTPNEEIIPKYEPTPGHAGGYDVTWGTHGHVDLAYFCKNDALERDIKWSLKPYVREVLGLSPIEVDREHMDRLTGQELRKYVASDGTITLALAEYLGL